LDDFHFTAPISTATEIVALKERIAKMESGQKREQQIGTGAAKEIPEAPKTSPSRIMSTIRAMERMFEDEKRKEEEQKKQQVASPEVKLDQPVGAKPLCESYSSRSSCQFDEVCAWANDRKQCEMKNGSLADAILDEMMLRDGYGIECKGIETLVGAGRRCLKAGSIFRDCPDCPQMVIVPAGTFTMGSPADEEGRSSDDGPQRKVTIVKPFAVGRFEVTFADWYACVSEKGCKHEPGDAGYGIGAGKRPVINVSWGDITKEFLPWLSSKTGKTYRLLSEAEWEYAARAGTSTPFSTGRTITPDQANFDGKRTNIEVGSFQANAFGLHDVYGNVREWVQDCYKDNYMGAPTDGSALPTADCSYRVVRGGSWSMNPRALRSASRYRFYAIDRDSAVGFRLGRTLSP
jgi:formylglycine-generating enzyme required for sulfatase activity